jgi:predicted transposase/invertase (TIGR01784 family)
MKKTPKKNKVIQPDDRFFKQLMSSKENASAYLEDFYPKIAAMAALETLEQAKGDFIRSNLKIFHSDIIYRCQFKGSEKQFYFSLIWEHKSKPEETVAIQVGLYVFELLYKMTKSKGGKLEPVLPLIFYNGKAKWTPKTVHELFKDQPYFNHFEPYLPNFSFLYRNIVETPIEELLALQAGFFRSAMMAMSFRHRGDLIMKNISIIFDVADKEHQRSLVTYVLAVVERSPKRFLEELERMEFTTKPNIMSTLAMLREEGRVEGRVEGRKEGRVEGEIRGKTLQAIKTLLMLLLFPKYSINELEVLTGFKKEVLIAFKKELQTGKKEKVRTFIKKHFLKEISLEKAAQEEIDELIVKLLRKLNQKSK